MKKIIGVISGGLLLLSLVVGIFIVIYQTTREIRGWRDAAAKCQDVHPSCGNVTISIDDKTKKFSVITGCIDWKEEKK